MQIISSLLIASSTIHIVTAIQCGSVNHTCSVRADSLCNSTIHSESDKNITKSKQIKTNSHFN